MEKAKTTDTKAPQKKQAKIPKMSAAKGKGIKDKARNTIFIAPDYKQKMSMPYILEIKNNSFERIFKFEINNLAQALETGEYDKRVTLSTPEYPSFIKTPIEIIEALQKGDVKIGRIRIECIHDYEKYARIQCSEPIFYNLNKGGKNNEETMHYMFVQLNQFMQYVVERDIDLKVDSKTNIKLSLMPEIFLRVFLFPVTDTK